MEDKIAHFELILNKGFLFENYYYGWNDDRLIHRNRFQNWNANNDYDSYDFIEFVDGGSNGFIFFLHYDDKNRLKKLSCPLNFKVSIDNIKIAYFDSLQSVLKKIENQYKLESKQKSKTKYILEELGLEIGSDYESQVFDNFTFYDFAN